MDHGLLGDDARHDHAPDDNGSLELEDSGDRGLEMDGGFDTPPAGDGAAAIQFAGDEPAAGPTTAVDVSRDVSPQGAAAAARVGAGEPAVKKTPPPMFESLEEWVYGWLLPLYRRSLDGSAVTFCREWWRHPEAYLRLDSLWKSWEYMRRKPGTGMAVWLKDYCDYHMGVLMREQGTFKGCTAERHNHEYALRAWQLAAMPSERQIARFYDRIGVAHTRPEGRSTHTGTATVLGSVRAREWDGIDQK